jgi:hypothetical protein
LTFTPVSQETFAKWCDLYKEKMRKIKEEMKTEKDLKLTGKQIFEQRKNIIEDIKIEEDVDEEEFKDEDGAGEEDEDQEGEAVYYDKALYE